MSTSNQQPERESGKLSMLEKVSYASGQVPGVLYGVIMGSIQTFYLAWMYLMQEWILIAQIIYGLWNLINDPLFGHLQDKTRTKKGRYLPWIKWCAPLFSIGFVLVFFPNPKWQVANSNMFDIEQILLFIWYMSTQMIYDTFFTIVYIAYTALLPQMTMDTTERTKVSILTTFAGAIGLAVSWIPVVFLTDPNPEKIVGLQISVIIIAIVAIFPWILVLKYVKERQEYIPSQETSFIENVKCVFKNPSGRIYMIYDGVSVGILNFIGTGITFALTWIFGLNSEYQEVNPDWSMMSMIPYLILPVICFIVGIIIQFKIPKKYDLKTALMFSLVTEAIGFFIAFIGCFPPSDLGFDQPSLPANLWLLSIGLSIAFLGFSGDFIYHNPMRADTIDYDEFLSGERRESVYAGVGCLLSKPMISVALASVTGLVTAFGLRATDPSMIEISTSLYWYQGYSRAMIGVAAATFLMPAILATIGAITWYFYPLNRKKLEELKNQLELMHKEKRKNNLNEDGTSKYV